MTSNELLDKLNASITKVNKRKENIVKLSKKLNINDNDLLSVYKDEASKVTQGYLSSRTCDKIVSRFISKKERYVDMSNDEYWKMCDFNSKISQLSDNLNKLYEIEKIAQSWQVKYDTQKNKEEAPKIEVLWNFLNEWEQKANKWFHQNAEMYFTLERDFTKNENMYVNSQDFKNEVINILQHSSLSNENEIKNRLTNYWKRHYYDNVSTLTKDITKIHYDYVYPDPNDKWKYDYVPKSYEIDEKKLSKALAQEKQAKYEDLCNRISSVVGEIIDCSNLSIGNQHGELNGIVKGTKGSAKVDTIGAGGYSIQVFHYRVLVHKID